MHYPPTTSSYDNLLTNLKNQEFLAGYHLTAYSQAVAGKSDSGNGIWLACCGAPGTLCSSICLSSLTSILEEAKHNSPPTLFRCPLGVLGFTIGMRCKTDPGVVLVAGGVRERSLDLYRIEAASKAGEVNPFALLEYLQDLPIVTEQQVKEAAERTYSIAISLKNSEPTPSEQAVNERLKFTAAISTELDRAKNANDIFNLLGESIGIIFDIPAIAAMTPEAGDNGYVFQQLWGAPLNMAATGTGTLTGLFPGESASRITLREEKVKELFPQSKSRAATCQPLVADEKLLGLLVLFGREFNSDECTVIELLTGRAALRLAKLRQEDEFARKSAQSASLFNMISTLAMNEGQELYDLILQMSTELADATCGSIMLIDEEKQLLRIEAAIGMSPHLLKVMTIKLGSGIAGKVAASGHPLLVNDIEKDERVGTPNRPRFKTKSFLSIPLMIRGEIFGVLNLSDKRDNGIFTERDITLLAPFVSHASSLLQRNCNQQKVELLERLSITDPLTELYNRRFLERRMDEEINRSLRNSENLTVMLIDLDYFKTYNDICGHVAGDRALKKTATVLRASVRDIDVVTRYGGEEFCVLLPNTSKRESIFVAERIRRDIETELFHGEEHLPLGRLTTSIGISSFPYDGATATAVINAADIALYDAKSTGRNRIVIFNHGTHSVAEENSPQITLIKKADQH